MSCICSVSSSYAESGFSNLNLTLFEGWTQSLYIDSAIILHFRYEFLIAYTSVLPRMKGAMARGHQVILLSSPGRFRWEEYSVLIMLWSVYKEESFRWMAAEGSQETEPLSPELNLELGVWIMNPCDIRGQHRECCLFLTWRNWKYMTW
jgi:hypothetical protein